MVVASLRIAVEAAAAKDEIEKFASMGDPAENKMGEPFTVPPDKRWSAKKWFAFYSSDALRRLESRESLDVLATKGPAPPWHAKYEEEIAAQRAEQERERKADELFESFYPEEVRAYFHDENLAATYVAEPGPLGADDGVADPRDDPERLQGERLAKAVDDPVALAVMSCRALGTLTNGWSGTDNKDRIAIHAAKTVSPGDFASALQQIEGDEPALLGAARMFFAEGYGASMSEVVRPKWATRLAEALLNSSLEDEKTHVLMALAPTKDAAIEQLYWKVARGELGAEKSSESTRKEEPSIRATAHLQLAARGVAEVQAAAMALLQNSRGPDRAAYELCLALLGDPSQIKAEHFRLDSYVVGYAAIRAIERSNDPEALDLLFAEGFENNYMNDECVLAAQRITGQKWVKEGDRRHESFYCEEARAWWAANRDEYIKAHVETER